MANSKEAIQAAIDKLTSEMNSYLNRWEYRRYSWVPKSTNSNPDINENRRLITITDDIIALKKQLANADSEQADVDKLQQYQSFIDSGEVLPPSAMEEYNQLLEDKAADPDKYAGITTGGAFSWTPEAEQQVLGWAKGAGYDDATAQQVLSAAKGQTDPVDAWSAYTAVIEYFDKSSASVVDADTAATLQYYRDRDDADRAVEKAKLAAAEEERKTGIQQDWRDFWDKQSDDASSEKLTAVNMANTFWNDQQDRELARQKALADLTPRQWLQASDLGQSPNLDWLQYLDVSTQDLANAKAQNDAYQQQLQEQRAQQAADAAEYYRRMGDYIEAQAAYQEYSDKLAGQDWFSAWQGTPNEDVGRQYLDSIIGPEVTQPTLPVYTPTATTVGANPLRSFIQNTPIKEAGAETYFNQLNQENQQRYLGLQEAKGWLDPEARQKQLYSGIVYGGLNRGRQVY